jgi:phosphatidylglycerophosphatase A
MPATLLLLPRRRVASRPPTLAIWIATVAGAGFFPVAPGTAGAAVGAALVALLWWKGPPPADQELLLIAAIVAVYFLGVWAATEAEKHFGRTDPGAVVIDEVAGQFATLLCAPHHNWKWLLAGFLLFRIFDVIKPFPARRAEHLPGGWGIMTDDVIAGFYGLLAMQALGPIFK